MRAYLGGGVKARLLWLGGAHTKGDELTLVEPDQTLISGDVVQNKTMPNIFGEDGTPTEWLATLDKVAMLNAAHVLPDHSAHRAMDLSSPQSANCSPRSARKPLHLSAKVWKRDHRHT